MWSYGCLLYTSELMDSGTVTDPKIGYVGAYPYAEVVSGYTAFLLGIPVSYTHLDVYKRQASPTASFRWG